MRARARPNLDVYLLPAVVGGGWGDIDEVRVAGTLLARDGDPVFLYRRPDRPLPRGVDGPWAWPPVRRVRRLPAHPHRSALTIAPSWGVSAAPTRDEPFGRGGPWELEAQEIEARYGPDRTVHISLEEFARTLTSSQEEVERRREGGWSLARIRAARSGPRWRSDVDRFRRAYRKYRAFDRANVLHIYATFRPSIRFGREHPEAVQTGPLGPIPRRHRRRFAAPRAPWVWYASPASAERLAPAIDAGLRGTDLRIRVRSPRRWSAPLPSARWTVEVGPTRPAAWARAFEAAPLRIVTGSRTLLEALAHGGPFLYFNGIVGAGARTRRHRPEKIDRLLATEGLPRDLRRDLSDFARGRRVADVVRRAARGRGGWARFPRGPWVTGFAASHASADRVVRRVARALAAGRSAPAVVAAERRAAPRGYERP